MDSRCIFLHHIPTELWGHGNEVWAGDGNTGASAVRRMGSKPPMQTESVTRSEQRVAKHMEGPSRKAAIVWYMPVPQTDTGG